MFGVCYPTKPISRFANTIRASAPYVCCYDILNILCTFPKPGLCANLGYVVGATHCPNPGHWPSVPCKEAEGKYVMYFAHVGRSRCTKISYLFRWSRGRPGSMCAHAGDWLVRIAL